MRFHLMLNSPVRLDIKDQLTSMVAYIVMNIM